VKLDTAEGRANLVAGKNQDQPCPGCCEVHQSWRKDQKQTLQEKSRKSQETWQMDANGCKW
jgi:hypothetical protein